jgi:tetratricopeptide (TPR) repeat protein
LLLGLGDTHDRAGNRDEAREAYGRCAEVAGRAGLPEELARAALGYGGRFVWGRAATTPGLVPLLESAVAALGPEDSTLRALLLARLAGATRVGSGDSAGGDTGRPWLADEAVAVARRLGDPGVLAYALEGQLHSSVGPGAASRLVALSTEMLELAAKAGDRERLFAAYENKVLHGWQLGDVATALTDLDEMSVLGESMRQPAQLWMLNAIHARVALCEGRLADAEELIERAFAYGESAQSWNAVVTHELQTYLLRRAQGRGAEPAPSLRAAIAERPHYQLLRCALANLEALAGDRATASRALDAFAASGFAVLPRDDTWLVGTTLLAEACHALGTAEHAATLYELMLPFENVVAAVPPDASMGAFARPLGLLAETLGDIVAAEAHFEHAVAVDERTGAWLWLSESRRALARLRDRR